MRWHIYVVYVIFFFFETAGVAVQGSQLQNKRINAKNAQKQRTMKN